MRAQLSALSVALTCMISFNALAQSPEIKRTEQAKPQKNGVVHTLRQIPEACARLEGAFTGDANEPYKFAPVKTSERCQPRARFVDAEKAKPSEAQGWILNDLIRIPSEACTGQEAVITVWRRPVANQTPKLDGQGRARIYLEDAKKTAEAGKIPAIPMFAAALKMDGKSCK